MSTDTKDTSSNGTDDTEANAGEIQRKEFVASLIKYGWNAGDLEKARELLIDEVPPRLTTTSSHIEAQTQFYK